MLKGSVALLFLAAATALAQSPGSLGNISTRLQVSTGSNVMIAGFIIQGNSPKKVIIRAAGPSLTQFGIQNALSNPQLELHDATSTIGRNDNWQTTQLGGVITSDQMAEIQNSGLAPGDSAESAIIATLPAGSYTAIVQGANDGTGVGIIELYDLSPGNGSNLANISTRGFVQTGNNVMIGGIIVVTQPIKVIVHAIGPSLIPFGVNNALTNPQLELHDANGTIAGNDDWQTTQIGGIITSNQVAEIQSTMLAPANTAESAIIATLAPGNYTAIVQGAGATTGVGLVEVFALSEYPLNVLKTGTGSGTVTSSPAGINCGSDCTETYYAGTVVTLTAAADAGSAFAGWSGACTGSGNCVVTVDAAKSVTAAFTLNPNTLTVTKDGNGSGTLTSSPAGINCGLTCAASYDSNTVVALTATPSTGSAFTGWSGACTGTGACNVTMDAAKSVTATFTLNTFTLSVSKSGNGSGIVTSSPTGINCGATCSADYNFNTTVTLTPAPSAGSAFSGWGGACSGTGACIVTIDAAKSVSASFTLITYTVSGFPSPQTAGVAGSITVTAKDGSGNTVTGYLGTVHFTSSDLQAVLPSDYTFVASDNGTHTFAGVTLKTVGSRSVTATDTVTSSITGAQTGITVNPAAATMLAVGGFPSPQTAGVAANVTVTAKDAFGNTATGYTGTIHVTSSDAQAVLPADYTFTGADNGVKSRSVTLKTAAFSQSITATDTVTASITAAQTGIQVNPASTSKLFVNGFPNPTTTGAVGSLTVTAQDAFNNNTPSYTGTVTFTSTNSSPVLPSNYTFMGLDAGVHVFQGVSLNGTGTSSITATDTANAGITGSQTGIVVFQGPNLFGGTATVINGGSRSGQIFIVGGSTDNTVANKLANTWFYNPATSTLTAGPSLVKARAFHTATAFGSSGQVLIAGGSTVTGSERELEICSTDGGAPTCTDTGGSLADNRCNGAAILFPGTTRVLIAGGDNCSNTTPLSTWTIWDAASPTSPVSGTMSAARRLLTATSVGTNKVLLAGGAAAATAELFTLNVATPASSTSTLTTGAMTATRTGHTATVLPQTTASTACPTASASNQCVLIAGGNSTSGKTWEIYDPSTNTFPTNASTAGASDLIVTQRTRHAAAVFSNGKVLLAGGQNSAATALSSTEVFNPTGSLSFSIGTPIQVTRTGPANAYSSPQNTLVLGGGSSSAPAIEQAATP